MANNVITTSIVVEFTDPEGSGILKVEIDDRPASEGGLNNGETSFPPGSSPGLLLYRSNNVGTLTQQTSEGQLAGAGTFLVQKQEFITFAGVAEAELSYPAAGGVNILRSMGVGGATLSGQTKMVLPSPGVGVIEVRYMAQAIGYRLVGAGSGMPVVVFFQGAVNP